MTVKLSEAIFLGSKLSRQAFGKMLRIDGSRCAFGAAMDAMGADLKTTSPKEFWPWTLTEMYTCPECSEVGKANFIIATHLNDQHRWSREKIADWVASVEPSEPVSTQIEGRAPVCTEPAKVAV